MVTDATKRVRDVLAYGLLAVAALYLIGGLSLLFKDGSDFSGKAAAFGHLFAHPVLVFSLVAAVALVVGFGESSQHARKVVLVALGIAGVSLLLALLCWLASFGADDSAFGALGRGGVFGAGDVVGSLLTLAQLLFLALAAWFAYTALQSLPKTSPSESAAWGQPSGYAGQQSYGETAWRQPGSGFPPASGWGSPQQQSPGWGTGQVSGPPVGAGAAGTWGDQSQSQAERQGQPASAWTTPEPGYPPATEQPPAWGQPAQPGQQQHGRPGQPAQGWQPAQPPPQPTAWGSPPQRASWGQPLPPQPQQPPQQPPPPQPPPPQPPSQPQQQPPMRPRPQGASAASPADGDRHQRLDSPEAAPESGDGEQRPDGEPPPRSWWRPSS